MINLNTLENMEKRFTSAVNFLSELKESTFLYKNIWRENTTSLLHSPRETDKTSLAIDIAVSVSATGRKVLYVDTQSSLSTHEEQLKAASDNLLVYIPAYDDPSDETDYADLVIAGIEKAVTTAGIRTFVIDSVSRIAALSFGRNASPAYVMKRLVALQVRCRLSLLVLAHDSTRAADRALLNLADSEIVVTDEDKGSQTVAAAKMEIVADVCNLSEAAPQSAPRGKMSRRERRLLRRAARKR